MFLNRALTPFGRDLALSIPAGLIAKAVEDIHKRDVPETATRILQHLHGVFRYAQAKGLWRHNPAGP